MLEIQKILRSRQDGIAHLKDRYAISTKRHSLYQNLVSFKYSQIDSPFSERVVQEARGIILDEKDNWNVVAMGFTKFFNYGESHAAPIDWLSATVQEKIDGSLIMLYWYDGDWQVATSGTPDASGEVNMTGTTFAKLFWDTATAQNTNLEYLSRSYTWILELTTPYNRVVVNHNDCKIWLLGARGTLSLEEVHPQYLETIGQTLRFNVPKRHSLYNINDCVKAAEALVPTEHEGFVVVDKSFNRIKIKSPAYVMLHHSKDSLSLRRMCDVVRKGEYAEFGIAIESLPEIKKIFDSVSAEYCRVKDSATEWFGKLSGIQDQKQFALQANQTGVQSLLFQMRKTGMTAAECMASPKMTTEHFMYLIGVKTQGT